MPKNVHIPAYNQKVRMAGFKCFETLLSNYTEFFKLEQSPEEMDVEDQASSHLIAWTDLISAVLNSIENEKDPRNLLVTFELTRLLLTKLGNDQAGYRTISPFIDDLFENVSCYYPIEFEPPKNDKFRITSKELKDKLNYCFVASKYLAGHAFPFILEKLTSVASFTKSESLRTLQLMLKSLPIQNIREFSEMVWNHLQNEAFNSYDQKVQTECVETISSLC
jgi:DNA repair/transcription protein MET18/MMS19